MFSNQLTSWKVYFISIVFIVNFILLPESLRAQNLQTRANTPTALQTEASGALGNLVQRPSLATNLRILFILVKYPGNPRGIILSSEAQAHRNELINALNTNSYNAATITIDITSTLTLPNSESFYQNSPLIRMREDAAKAAEQAGFDLDSYDREIIFSKKVWKGANNIGTINRRTAVMSTNLPYVAAHELGHSLGWRHANFWKVSSGSPISSNATEVQYGDKYDMMGGSSGPVGPYTPNDYHHFNPWLKQRVGWLPQQNILTVTNSGIYTIQAIETTPMSPPVTKYTALRIRKDPLTDYYIFFRSQESFISNGPVITRIFNNNINPTQLLDMTPGSQNEDWRDADLAVDSTFSDAQAGISVTVLSRSSSEVQVDVTVDANAIASMDNLPVIDVISPLEGVTVKGGIDYEVTAFDPDFGTTNGAGIDKVKLYIHPLNDPVILALRQGLDPPTPVAITELSALPYRWYVDTNSLPQDGPYFFILRAISLDDGTQTLWFPHIVDNLGMPATPVLSSPANNMIDVSTGPTLAWNASSGAVSYRLQVSTVSDFSTTVVDLAGLVSNSFTLSSLANITAYYWRVNATNSTGTTAWSPVWQFTTMGAGSAPAAPALSSPVDNATGLFTNFSLIWNPASGATSYRLQVSTVADFSTTFINPSGITSNIYSISGLTNNTTYYWRVNATNANGTSPYSTAWKFTTIVAAPAAPALLTPSDNATDIVTDTTLAWASSNGATLYQLQVSTVLNFSIIEFDQSGLTTTSFPVTGLSNSTVYFWRVKASNAGGESPWSTVRRFTTIVAAPAAPVLSSPGDNTIDVSTDTTLVWNSSTGAVSYGLQVSTTSDFSSTVVEQNELTETSFLVNNLENETTYFWHVNASNAGGTSPWSTVRKFTTEQVTSVETGSEIPSEFRLGQNYPNPFNPTTNITFDLPNSEYVSLKVYTLLGTEVAILVSENLPAGEYTIKFDASRLSSGLFFYKLHTSSFVETRKMLLVR